MEKGKNLQVVIIAVLAVAILFMSIGFAAYQQTLNINGDITVEPAKWSVHFKPDTFALASGSVESTNDPVITNTDITYTATLSKPGDYYSFTIDVVNDGTFDANLVSVSMGGLTSATEKYVDYTVTYDGQVFEGTETGLSKLLPAKTDGTDGKATATVNVMYSLPKNDTDLPTEAVTVNLTCALAYEQAD